MPSLRAWDAPLSALTLAAVIFAAPALAQEDEARSIVLRSAILLFMGPGTTTITVRLPAANKNKGPRRASR
jgi:hypothetical protein